MSHPSLHRPIRATLLPAALLLAGVIAPALGLMRSGGGGRGGVSLPAACGAECRVACGVLATSENSALSSDGVLAASGYQVATKDATGQTPSRMTHFCSAAPQRDSGNSQTRVGELQTRVGDSQTRVGDSQTRVGDSQTRVGDSQTRVGDSQTRVGDSQTRVGDSQTRVGDAQTRVGELQTRVGDSQTRVSDPLPNVCELESKSPDDPPAAPDAPSENAATKTPPGFPTAAELEPNLGWLNTDTPLRLSDELKGHVVVLDFWTYCCINCVHILPDLAAIEEKFKDQPVIVIGVHSAKFDNESDRKAIRAAMQRYAIHHPVVVDQTFGIWGKYGAKGWPSFAVIGADGKLVPISGPMGNDFITSGETPAKTLAAVVERALAEAKASGTLAPVPFRPKLDANVPASTGLAFPGKVIAVAAAPDAPGFLFVADSTNNRVVQATLPDDKGRSTLVDVYGSREPGLVDGPQETARFRDPQGMAFDRAKNVLYVADSKSHAIRAIDLKKKTTTTLVGDGVLSNDRAGGKLGAAQRLNSPWDLALTFDGSAIYVAMAGTHQLWSIALPSHAATAIAGGQGEDLVDATAKVARLAQPSGLALSSDGTRLYFADSECSAVRSLNFKSNQVRTIIGVGLFQFGDVDGAYPDARLQHPLGIALWPKRPGEENASAGERLLVADTYNHKIKLIDVKGESSTTWIGVGRANAKTKRTALVLDEPGGLSLLRDNGPPVRDWLFIADTNNHRIIRVDVATKAWVQVEIDGLAARDAPKSK